jgi:hypothetical protein
MSPCMCAEGMQRCQTALGMFKQLITISDTVSLSLLLLGFRSPRARGAGRSRRQKQRRCPGSQMTRRETLSTRQLRPCRTQYRRWAVIYINVCHVPGSYLGHTPVGVLACGWCCLHMAVVAYGSGVQ